MTARQIIGKLVLLRLACQFCFLVWRLFWRWLKATGVFEFNSAIPFLISEAKWLFNLSFFIRTLASFIIAYIRHTLQLTVIRVIKLLA
ncbi:hypothetical protein K449DRAFT_69245 [Hypoxylon sp. EC38]|nr:hypothetical protein K449DRAFT_69245 [Hypoxylon sp. EC38]